MQRALFARLLLQDARVIVLDEPFNAIDAKTASDLLDLVHALACREAHGRGGAARPRTASSRCFPRRCCWRASRSRWGNTEDGAHGRRTCEWGGVGGSLLSLWRRR